MSSTNKKYNEKPPYKVNEIIEAKFKSAYQKTLQKMFSNISKTVAKQITTK